MMQEPKKSSTKSKHSLRHSPIDKLLIGLDTALRSLCIPDERVSQRKNPADCIQEPELSPAEKKHAAGLMRINHSGEVCAQALYQGQALTANLAAVREQMNQAAEEESEHLAWCEKRLAELNSKPSKLNAFWYMQSFLLGAAAGLAGDKWSLGFVAETERQVTAHLEKHLAKLPVQDQKSQAILEQMKEDESEHAKMAEAAGAALLPGFIKETMGFMSKIMTKSSYYF